eukprot:486874_1
MGSICVKEKPDEELDPEARLSISRNKRGYRDSVMVITEFWELLKADHDLDAIAGKLSEEFFSSYPEYKDYNDVCLQSVATIKKFDESVKMMKLKTDRQLLRRRLRELGQTHSKHNIPEEAYVYLVDAFVKTMNDLSTYKIDPRTNFCIRKIMLWVTEQMKMGASASQVGNVGSELAPSDDVRNNPIFDDFPTFVSNKVCMNYMHTFLIQKLCEENTFFLKDLSTYEENPSLECAKFIVNTYLDSNAAKAINVGFQEVSNIESKMADPETQCAPDLFDDVKSTILQLIKTNSWSAFKTSVYAGSLVNHVSRVSSERTRRRVTTSIQPFNSSFTESVRSEKSSN